MCGGNKFGWIANTCSSERPAANSVASVVIARDNRRLGISSPAARSDGGDNNGDRSRDKRALATDTLNGTQECGHRAEPSAPRFGGNAKIARIDTQPGQLIAA